MAISPEFIYLTRIPFPSILGLSATVAAVSCCRYELACVCRNVSFGAAFSSCRSFRKCKISDWTHVRSGALMDAGGSRAHRLKPSYQHGTSRTNYSAGRSKTDESG
jgi:hypothetical protein